MEACEYLIDLKGGHCTLGLNGFLSQIIMQFKEELSSIEGNGATEDDGSKARSKIVARLPSTASP